MARDMAGASRAGKITASVVHSHCLSAELPDPIRDVGLAPGDAGLADLDGAREDVGECRFMAQSGHWSVFSEMSAFGGKADVARRAE